MRESVLVIYCYITNSPILSGFFGSWLCGSEIQENFICLFVSYLCINWDGWRWRIHFQDGFFPHTPGTLVFCGISLHLASSGCLRWLEFLTVVFRVITLLTRRRALSNMSISWVVLPKDARRSFRLSVNWLQKSHSIISGTFRWWNRASSNWLCEGLRKEVNTGRCGLLGRSSWRPVILAMDFSCFLFLFLFLISWPIEFCQLGAQYALSLVNTMQKEEVGIFGTIGMEKVDGELSPSMCWRSHLSRF